MFATKIIPLFAALAIISAGSGLALADQGGTTCTAAKGTEATAVQKPAAEGAQAPATNDLPTMLDLSTASCGACQAMKPIVEDFEKKYGSQVNVKMIDVLQDSEAAQKYAVLAVPTFVFLNAKGEEIGRHVGYCEQDVLVDLWKNLGYDLTTGK